MIYKKTLTVAVLALSSTFAAFAADDGGLPAPKPEAGTTKSRADVKAERTKAAKNGELNQSDNAGPVLEKGAPAKAKTRAEVKAEIIEAKIANGGSLKTPKE